MTARRTGAQVLAELDELRLPGRHVAALADGASAGLPGVETTIPFAQTGALRDRGWVVVFPPMSSDGETVLSSATPMYVWTLTTDAPADRSGA